MSWHVKNFKVFLSHGGTPSRSEQIWRETAGEIQGEIQQIMLFELPGSPRLAFGAHRCPVPNLPVWTESSAWRRPVPAHCSRSSQEQPSTLRPTQTGCCPSASPSLVLTKCTSSKHLRFCALQDTLHLGSLCCLASIHLKVLWCPALSCCCASLLTAEDFAPYVIARSVHVSKPFLSRVSLMIPII